MASSAADAVTPALPSPAAAVAAAALCAASAAASAAAAATGAACPTWITCSVPALPAALVGCVSYPAASDASGESVAAPSAHHLLDLGECRLGSVRTCSIQLTNQSDAHAECSVHYSSAAGTVEVEPLTLHLPARASVSLTVRVRARQLNPHYHKQLLIVNAHNSCNVISVLLRCNNTLDRFGAAYHNQFYHVIDPARTAAAAAAAQACIAAEDSTAVAAASPPPPMLPVGFRETPSGRIMREEPEEDDDDGSATGGGGRLPQGNSSTALSGDDDPASSSASEGALSRMMSRRQSSASAVAGDEDDDRRSDRLLSVHAVDDSDLPPGLTSSDPAHLARMIDLAQQQQQYTSDLRSGVPSNATSPAPFSPTMLDRGMSRNASTDSLYQQQLLLQNSSSLNTPINSSVAATLGSECSSSSPRGLASLLPAARPTNVIPLGTLVCNHPIMRAFDVKNITGGRLRLRLSTSLDADRFAVAARAAAAAATAANCGSSVDAAIVPPVSATAAPTCISEEMILFVKNDAKFAACGLEVGPDGSMRPRLTAMEPSDSPSASAASAAIVGDMSSPLQSPSSVHSPSLSLHTFSSFLPAHAACAGGPASPASLHDRHPSSSSSIAAASSFCPLPPTVLDSWFRFESVATGSREHSAVYSRFADLQEERAYVKKFITQRRDMDTVLKEKLLLRIDEPAAVQHAASQGQEEDFCAPPAPNELVLAPFETKRVFVFVNMQSHLALSFPSNTSAATAAPPSDPLLLAPPSTPLLGFLNKDFARNKLIRLDERELKMRDSQQFIPASTAHASLTPASSLNSIVDAGMRSGLTSPSTIGTDDPAAGDGSMQPLSFPDASPSSSSASVVQQPSSSPPVSAAVTEGGPSSVPGLQVRFELIEYAGFSNVQSQSIATPIPVDSGTGGSQAAMAAGEQEVSAHSRAHSVASSDGTMRPSTLAVHIPSSSSSSGRDSVPPAAAGASTPCSSAVTTSTPPAPIRQLLFPAFLCRSHVEVAQKHINFGQLLNMNLHLAKSLILSNLSEVPLLYSVRQTGSIASLDLTFPRGDIGVVPPLGYTDLPFLFKPSLAGRFLEPIHICNVQDSSNVRVINVKAYLRKPVHFWIQQLRLDFKAVCAGREGMKAHWVQQQNQQQLQQNQQMQNQHGQQHQVQAVNNIPSAVPSSGTAVGQGSMLVPHPYPSPSPLRRGSSLTPSASTGSLSQNLLPLAPSSTFLPPASFIATAVIQPQQPTAAPILVSHQRIVVKNISLKARTFKIKLVEWERQCIKVKRRVVAEQEQDSSQQQTETDAPPASASVVESFIPPSFPPFSLPPLAAPTLTLKLEDVALGSASALSLFEREEEEEKLNHKLRIAIRKKKTEKVDKIRHRLFELREMKMEAQHSSTSSSGGGGSGSVGTGGGAAGGGDPAHGGNSASSDGSHTAEGDKNSHATNETHDSIEGITFTLEPNAVQNVRATTMPSFASLVREHGEQSVESFLASTASEAGNDPPQYIEFYTGLLHVYETKNKEIVKEVKCCVAFVSDVATQEEFLADPSAWAGSGAEDTAQVEEIQEEEDVAEDETNGDGGMALDQSSLHAEPGSLAGDDVARRRAEILSSPRSAQTVPDVDGSDLPRDELLFVRSRSLPLEHDATHPPDASLQTHFTSTPVLTEQSLLELDAIRPCAGLDSARSGESQTPGEYPSSTPSTMTQSPNDIALSTGQQQLSLLPVAHSPLVDQLLRTPPWLSRATLSVLLFPHLFPVYSPTVAPSAQLALSARSHALFFQLLNAHTRGAGGGGGASGALQLLPPEFWRGNSASAVATGSSTALTTTRGALPLPFSTFIPLEFVASPSSNSNSSGVPLLGNSPRNASRSHSSPARESSRSSSSKSGISPRGDQTMLGSPFRLLSGTAASIFRVYIEDQVPMSLPSPSFFKLTSHVSAHMIIEVKWVPDAATMSEHAQQQQEQKHAAATTPQTQRQQQEHFGSLAGGRIKRGMSANLGRPSANNVAPPTLSSSTPQAADGPAGGFMRVYVKPAASLLVPPQALAHYTRPTPPSLPAASLRDRRYRTAVPPSRSSSSKFTGLDTPPVLSSSHHALSPPSPSPVPLQSLYLFVPANAEVDVFMCWLAALHDGHDSTGAGLAGPHSGALHSQKKQLRRSSSSVGAGGSVHAPFASVAPGDVSPSVSSSGASHGSQRWKKAIALADKSVLAEAVLAPSAAEVDASADATTGAGQQSTSTNDSSAASASTDAPAVSKRPSLSRSATLNPARFGAVHADPAAKPLPRGHLLIRPVGFPQLRSMLGVEVCSMAGSVGGTMHAQVSPLMLTPERIHAGVVLVDMEGSSTAAANDGRGIGAGSAAFFPRRPSIGSITVSSASLSSGIVRGSFVIYNSTTSRSGFGVVPPSPSSSSSSSSGRVTVVLGQQSKETLTSPLSLESARPHFSFRPARAVIPPNDSRVVEFTCRVKSLGHQTHGILVRDCTNDIDIALPVTFTAKEPVFLRFIDCKENATQFDVGLIFALQKMHAGSHDTNDMNDLAPSSTMKHRPPQLLLSPPSTPLQEPTRLIDRSLHEAAVSTARPPAPSSRRFSKLVSFRVQNARDYPVRVHVGCNVVHELHVYDGEHDRSLRRCLSCPHPTCSAKNSVMDDNQASSTETSVADEALRLKHGPHVLLAAHSTHQLLLAFSPLLSDRQDEQDMKDETRSFTAGLSFFVYPHLSGDHASSTVAHTSPKKRLLSLQRVHSSSTPAAARRHPVRFFNEGDEDAAEVMELSVDSDSAEDDDADTATTEEEDDDDLAQSGAAAEFGSVVGLGHAALSSDRCVAELHVRVSGEVGVSTLCIRPVPKAAASTPEVSLQVPNPAAPVCTDSTVATDGSEPSNLDAPVLGEHQFTAVDQRSSSIDFNSASQPIGASNQSPAPLSYALELQNTSLLPLRFRLVPSSSSVQVRPTYGVLAPGASMQLDLLVERFSDGPLQEQISVLVAQQARVDYSNMESEASKQLGGSPALSAFASASNRCAEDAVAAPHPPSSSSRAEVPDLLGLREEVLHTIFLRAAGTVVQNDQLEMNDQATDGGEVQAELEEFGDGSVSLLETGECTGPASDPADSGRVSPCAEGAVASFVMPAYRPAPLTRRAAKLLQLAALLNPSAAAALSSDGVDALAATPGTPHQHGGFKHLLALEKQLQLSPLALPVSVASTVSARKESSAVAPPPAAFASDIASQPAFMASPAVRPTRAASLPIASPLPALTTATLDAAVASAGADVPKAEHARNA